MNGKDYRKKIEEHRQSIELNDEKTRLSRSERRKKMKKPKEMALLRNLTFILIGIPLVILIYVWFFWNPEEEVSVDKEDENLVEVERNHAVSSKNTEKKAEVNEKKESAPKAEKEGDEQSKEQAAEKEGNNESKEQAAKKEAKHEQLEKNGNNETENHTATKPAEKKKLQRKPKTIRHKNQKHLLRPSQKQKYILSVQMKRYSVLRSDTIAIQSAVLKKLKERIICLPISSPLDKRLSFRNKIL